MIDMTIITSLYQSLQFENLCFCPIVFTAGIGEHATEIWPRVCADARWIGVSLDEVANNKGGPRISLPTLKVSVWVVPTNENLMVARHTPHLLDSRMTAR